jgi:hypothetical protein
VTDTVDGLIREIEEEWIPRCEHAEAHVTQMAEALRALLQVTPTPDPVFGDGEIRDAIKQAYAALESLPKPLPKYEP